MSCYYYYYCCTSSCVWHHHFCVFRSGNSKMSSSFYFSRLKIPPLTSWLYIECSDHPHCHLQDSLSMTVLSCSGQPKCWIEHSRNGLTNPELPYWTCWLYFYQGTPGCCWPSSLQGHIGGACSSTVHLDHSVIFIQSFFPAVHTPSSGVWYHCP